MSLQIAVFLIKRNYNSLETFISELKSAAEDFMYLDYYKEIFFPSYWQIDEN